MVQKKNQIIPRIHIFVLHFLLKWQKMLSKPQFLFENCAMMSHSQACLLCLTENNFIRSAALT